MNTHINPTMEAGRRLMTSGMDRPVTMLNLLRFRSMADYSLSPAFAPPAPISGEAAFNLYVTHTMPFLNASGGQVLLMARGGPWFIGPEGETWDLAMIVRQSSVASFIAFASNEAYLEGLAHRTAAIEDARLLPLDEFPVS